MEIELSSGVVVKVYPAGTLAMIAIEAAIALPTLPMVSVEIETGAGGSHTETHPADSNSPAMETYRTELRAANEARAKAYSEGWLLLGLRDVEAPADWVFPPRLQMMGVKPGEGERGRLLDYIRYDLLANGGDLENVGQAIRTQSYGTAELAAQLESSFRGTGDHQRRDPAGVGSAASLDPAGTPDAGGIRAGSA